MASLVEFQDRLLEAMLVIEARKGQGGTRELDLLLYKARIEILPFSSEHVEIARYAWRTYGKGRHPAALNFGDCFAYALAKMTNEPLLSKGNDFIQTGVQLVDLTHTHS